MRPTKNKIFEKNEGASIRVELRDLSKAFGDVVANDGVSFHVESGEILGLVGENGAGKSTCMNMLFGHIEPDRGTILLNNEEVRFRSPKEAILAGIGMVHIPYKGAAPAMQDLLSGVVELSFESSLTNTVANYNSGRLKVLATTGSKRVPILGNIPTVAESGYPGFVAQGWFGFFGPAGLPPAITKRLNEIATNMLRDKAVVEKFDNLGIQADPLAPEQFVKFLQEQDRIWAGTAKGLNLQLD